MLDFMFTLWNIYKIICLKYFDFFLTNHPLRRCVRVYGGGSESGGADGGGEGGGWAAGSG